MTLTRKQVLEVFGRFEVSPPNIWSGRCLHAWLMVAPIVCDFLDRLHSFRSLLKIEMLRLSRLHLQSAALIRYFASGFHISKCILTSLSCGLWLMQFLNSGRGNWNSMAIRGGRSWRRMYRGYPNASPQVKIRHALPVVLCTHAMFTKPQKH